MNQQCINDMESLLDWILSRMLLSQTSAPTSSACVALFVRFVDDLKTWGRSWQVVPKRLVQVMASNTGTTTASAKLMTVLEECMEYVECDYCADDDFVFAKLPVFIEIASDELKLGLTITRSEDEEVFTVEGELRQDGRRIRVDVHYTPPWL